MTRNHNFSGNVCCCVFANSCFLHDEQFYMSSGFAPILLLTVFSIIIIVQGRVPCGHASRRAGRRNSRLIKPFKTTACVLYMAVTWSLCLSFLVLEESSLAIGFSLLNIFQGPLVLPFLVRVVQNNLKKAKKPDIKSNEIALIRQTQQPPVKVCPATVDNM